MNTNELRELVKTMRSYMPSPAECDSVGDKLEHAAYEIDRLKAEAVAADIRIGNDALEVQRIYATLDSHAKITQKAEQAVSDQPKARANDPATSKAAAKAVKPKVPSLKETILFLLADNPAGLTGTEIESLSGKRLNSITPRFAALYRGSKIKSTAYSSYRNGETVWVLA